MATPASFEIESVFPLPKEMKGEMARAIELLSKAKRVLISSTLTSDGDSIGAQLGILFLIEKLRPSDFPEVYIVNESPVPPRYQFLEGSSKIISWADWESKKLKVDFDCAVVCDGGIERTGKVAALFKDLPCILVDHHVVGSELSYSAKLLDTSSSSTCEIVYFLYRHAGFPLTKKLAEALYIGMVFDTGFFKHSITTPRTHLVASQLIGTGIDFSEISERALLERSANGQELLKRLLINMQIEVDGKLVSSHWSEEDLNAAQAEDGDSEGMINQLYHTRGAEVVALFVEAGSQKVKVSFRSKGRVNVAEFARSLTPHGGGHVRAAGCSLEGSLKEIKQKVLQKLRESLA